MQVDRELALKQDDVDAERFDFAMTHIQTLTEETIKCLRQMPSEWRHDLYLGHSGGKDSCVVHSLSNWAFLQYIPVVHTPKPGVTHPKTLDFLYSRMFPIKYVPACCHKENVPYKTQIDGSRRDEYNRTNGRSTDIVVQGKNVSRKFMTMFVENGLFGLNFVYPICFWTNEDVWAYIVHNEIEISEEYAR